MKNAVRDFLVVIFVLVLLAGFLSWQQEQAHINLACNEPGCQWVQTTPLPSIPQIIEMDRQRQAAEQAQKAQQGGK